MGEDAEAKLRSSFCDVLVRTGAITFGMFKLTSGKLSPYYVDLRILPSFPHAFRIAIDAYQAVIGQALGGGFDRIVGIPTAGVPFAAILAYALSKPFLYIRKEAKPHGRERKIEGTLFPGDRVMVVDDLITTGKSTVQAVEIVKSEGGVVNDSIVLLDRQEGGAERLEKMGVKLHSFMKISDVAKRLLEMGAVDEDRYNEIIQTCKA